jgi:D-xylonolactonase
MAREPRMQLEALVTGYGLVEGPRDDGAGGLFFSDVTRGGVYHLDGEGRVETIVPRRRGVGGIVLHAEGGLVISGRNVCHVRDGETRVLLARDDVPGFNDLFADADGRVYVGSLRSDPFRGGDRIPGELYRIDAEGESEVVYEGVGLSNGIGLSPDGRWLYHADTSTRSVWIHEVGSKGRELFVSVEAGAPDGLCVDIEGGVWVASFGGGCVLRYRADGALDRRLEVPARSVTSVSFGGSERRDLFVVSADHTQDPSLGGCVFRARSDVAGLVSAPARI